jgi:hypothetical protein
VLFVPVYFVAVEKFSGPRSKSKNPSQAQQSEGAKGS